MIQQVVKNQLMLGLALLVLPNDSISTMKNKPVERLFILDAVEIVTDSRLLSLVLVLALAVSRENLFSSI